MKTGNKILIFTITFVAFVMLAGAVDWRFIHHKSKSGFVHSDEKSEILTITDFKYVNVSSITKITMGKLGKPGIEIKYQKNSSKPQLNLHVSGDTLYIKPNKYSGNIIELNLFSSSEILSIVAIDSKIGINVNKTGNLMVDLDNTELNDIYIDSDEGAIDNLNILAKNNSQIRFSNTAIQFVNVNAANTNLNFRKKIKKLSGLLREDSKMDCREIEEINLKKEEGCQVSLH